MTHILRIDASARGETSVSRALTQRILDRFKAEGDVTVTERDVASNEIPAVDSSWVAANFTPEADRSPAQREELALSDTLLAELEAADVLVIGLPVYNFAPPATLKAWIDQIARAGRAFQYTENGPQGLLGGKRAIVAVASGGTRMGSDIDFATGYLRHILGFIGITDVSFVAADQVAIDPQASVKAANAEVDKLDLAA